MVIAGQREWDRKKGMHTLCPFLHPPAASVLNPLPPPPSVMRVDGSEITLKNSEECLSAALWLLRLIGFHLSPESCYSTEQQPSGQKGQSTHTHKYTLDLDSANITPSWQLANVLSRLICKLAHVLRQQHQAKSRLAFSGNQIISLIS